jgi:hypothetical protein
MSHWFRRIIDNVLSRAAPAFENSHSANSEVRTSWQRHVTSDVLARAGTPTLPHGPHHIPHPVSASDFAACRAGRRADVRAYRAAVAVGHLAMTATANIHELISSFLLPQCYRGPS